MFYWKAKIAEGAALAMLEEAARSDRLVAEEMLQGGKDADALAYLARAGRYVPKSSFPRGDAGWKIVNSSRRISVPNFSVCLLFTQVMLSERTYVFWISTEGRNVGDRKSVV